MAEYIVDTDYSDGYTAPELMDEAVALMGKLNPRELVRCRDCANAHRLGMSGTLVCSHFAEWDYCNNEPGSCMVDPDGYCFWGERREDA